MSNKILEEMVNIVISKNLVAKGLIPEIDKNTPIKSLQMDSLDMVEFILDMENKYDIRIPGDTFDNNPTLGEVASKIEKLIEEEKSK